MPALVLVRSGLVAVLGTLRGIIADVHFRQANLLVIAWPPNYATASKARPKPCFQVL